MKKSSRIISLVVLLIFMGAGISNAAAIYVSIYGAVPNDGQDDTNAINAAITAAGHGDIVSFSAGTYDLITPYDTGRFIKISSKTGVTLQGETSGGLPNTTLLRHVVNENMADPPRTIYVVGSANIAVRNFIIDNTPHLCSLGTVTYKSSTTIRVQIPVDQPMVSGRACYAANAWEQAWDNLKEVPSLTTTTSPANWTIYDSENRIMQLYKSTGLGFTSNIAVNDRISWHYGWNGKSQIEVGKTDGMTIDNLEIRNAINMAILMGATNDIMLTNITMLPVGSNLAVGPRDGVHLSRCTGTVIADNLYITGVRMDGFVVRTPYAEITSKTNSTHFRIHTELTTYGQTIAGGTGISIFSSTGNIYNRSLSSANWVSDADGGSYYDIVTATDIPDWAGVGTCMKIGGLMPSSVSLTNSTFVNLAGAAVVALADNITLDNIDCYKLMYPAIHIGDDPGAGSCPSNVTVRNSTFEKSGWELGFMTGRPGLITLENTHSTYTEPKLHNITIQNNIFKNQLWSSSWPSVNVYDTDGITISGNLFENVYKGLKIDTATTTNYTVTGNAVVIDNTGNSATYTEVLGSFAASGLTGYNGTDTRYSGSSGAKARWTFICPKSGIYNVYIYKIYHTNSDTNAKISTTYDGGTDIDYVNYATGSSGWVLLGTHAFTGQSTYTVTNERSNGYLRTDAVRFIQQ